MRSLLMLIPVLSVLILSGCTGTQERDLDADGRRDGVDVSPLDEDCKPPCTFSRSAINDPMSPLSERFVFFDYDRSEIKSQFQKMLVAHGQYLASYPDVRIRLEGHTDERGSREYNLALGEQRAKAVRQVLLLQGASDKNITVVSFGEEVPLEQGNNESAWSQNRRVELIYETR